jgi:hypothetical protein
MKKLRPFIWLAVGLFLAYSVYSLIFTEGHFSLPNALFAILFMAIGALFEFFFRIYSRR